MKHTSQTRAEDHNLSMLCDAHFHDVMMIDYDKPREFSRLAPSILFHHFVGLIDD